MNAAARRAYDRLAALSVNVKVPHWLALELSSIARVLAPRLRVKKDIDLPERPKAKPTTREVWAACAARAGGRCEACGRRFTPWLQATMDHWLNGVGRRRQMESIETCWMLCGPVSRPGTCHHDRQQHLPSAAVWNAKFSAHCEKYGYPFTPHVEHQELSR